MLCNFSGDFRESLVTTHEEPDTPTPTEESGLDSGGPLTGTGSESDEEGGDDPGDSIDPNYEPGGESPSKFFIVVK